MTSELFESMERDRDYISIARKISFMLRRDPDIAELIRPIVGAATRGDYSSQKAVNQLGRMVNLHLLTWESTLTAPWKRKIESIASNIALNLVQKYPQTIRFNLSLDEAYALKMPRHDLPHKWGMSTTIGHQAAYHEAAARAILDGHPEFLDITEKLLDGKSIYESCSLVTVIASHIPILNDIVDRNPVLLYKPVYANYKYTTLGEGLIKEMVDDLSTRRFRGYNITAVSEIFGKMVKRDPQFLRIMDEHLIQISERKEIFSDIKIGELGFLKDHFSRHESNLTEILRRLYREK